MSEPGKKLRLLVTVATEKRGSECQQIIELDAEFVGKMSQAERRIYIEDAAEEALRKMTFWNWEEIK